MLETEVPTRADIAKILAKTKSKKGLAKDKAGRNTQRKLAVRSSIPVEVFTQMESDLASYPEWEIEKDDLDNETK